MPAGEREKLYSLDLLGLAVRLSQYPFHKDWSLVGEARSRTCGSVVQCCIQAESDRIVALGLQVSACAVGQAAAAIFAAHAEGYGVAELARTEGQLEAWLAGGGTLPNWPEIEKLQPALPFPARHRAILLPWTAAMRALSKA
ncbi:iron-sulfur cluster assembly scaffold protein [Qipengyuania oceanensis]|uniref:Iron-sulfur cluster assembly scaffold protein n=1 Tax=Qipengyuania oceanensis TaxID=1463597 RepID=A0A844YF75_9SPHN|nr:iron-sulfur cluster assembly scaffold protein [Qipengyuania oceanensis]MXO61694.1 iron-sulfur cluster assembly scaffold protein [Qipengyuania oceanensis]